MQGAHDMFLWNCSWKEVKVVDASGPVRVLWGWGENGHMSSLPLHHGYGWFSIIPMYLLLLLITVK